MTDASLFYTGLGLDRATERRRDAGWISSLLSAQGARVVPIWRTQNLMSEGESGPRAGFLSVADAIALGASPSDMALLGNGADGPVFAYDVSAVEDPAAVPALASAGRFSDLRGFGPLLPRPEATLLAYARGLAWWHSRHLFCGVCGAPTVSADAGHVRHCTRESCGTHHFPRTDPAVIMLVHDGDRALLGRQSRFPPGMYSTLAGFVEPGESLEEAVAREVREEAGVEVGEIRYVASQPWPFPSSVMLGFTAKALTTELRVDPEELEDARWFTRDEILSSEGDGSFRLPRPDSIARFLVEGWLRSGG
ncbi:NAD(+) diphosphatase [Arenibaculum pallidiluteum]|uniref:NAD(+) diphosphatase n=1 Tax=Arenibaculum pallidiluteum TaxID=2812559 RepID=UPI001A956A0E|nr:NAD(+) diphosphatase [Arenibaculum pallidiluteum]